MSNMDSANHVVKEQADDADKLPSGIQPHISRCYA